ncbi:hypothetical protein [Algisphaera agarilytica]|uniref:Uncharacterized protein n=1 Tax=Algisphaera agarilytica TaxID=1385975 RepID=A0A7X0H7Z0_9BACT|nr:hypothetical protein [Algisphaera agarilytica]MBB6429489.1 hypothetical protein [Algisphaera agarilytica]
MSLPSDLPAPSPSIDPQPNAPPLDFSRIPRGALDNQGRVDCELLCRQCGYNLRTMDARGDCPECGTAVHWSLIGDLLRFGDANWLRTLARGMAWVLAVLLVSIVTGIFIELFGVAYDFYMFLEVFVLVFTFLATLATAYGYWRLTTPEPQPDPSIVIPGGTRAWARGLLMIYSGFSLVTAGLSSLTLGTSYDRSTLEIDNTIEALDSVAGLIGLAGLFCLAVVLRRLARRAPHPGIARQTTILIWAWAVTLGLFVFSLIALSLASAYSGGNPTAPTPLSNRYLLSALGCGGGLTAVVLGIWSMILMLRYHNLFRRHARYASFRIPDNRPIPRADWEH